MDARKDGLMDDCIVCAMAFLDPGVERARAGE